MFDKIAYRISESFKRMIRINKYSPIPLNVWMQLRYPIKQCNMIYDMYIYICKDVAYESQDYIRVNALNIEGGKLTVCIDKTLSRNSLEYLYEIVEDVNLVNKLNCLIDKKNKEIDYLGIKIKNRFEATKKSISNIVLRKKC